jgi:hypothetical protein
VPDLTGLPALDLAIGLAFIYLLLSLLASAVQEVIAGWLAMRAATLEKGLRNMLETDSGLPPGAASLPPGPDAPAQNLVDNLYAHPLIRSMYKQSWWPLHRRGRGEGTAWANGRLPSYIAPRSFALALFDTLAPNASSPDEDGKVPESHDVIATVRGELVTMNIPAGVKHRLVTILDDARGDIDSFRQGLEAWFDDSMARVSGWYKRKTQLILLVLAVIVTVGVNANTLTIGERLWKDEHVRAAVVQRATSSDVTGKTAGATAKERLDNAANDVDSVAKLGVPIGWSGNGDDPRHVNFDDGKWIRVLGGWFLTFAAISLGAPFWFDTLSRLSRLRSSGKPETPLPASGRGQPAERVVTQTPPVNVTLTLPPGTTPGP